MIENSLALLFLGGTIIVLIVAFLVLSPPIKDKKKS
jgi:hypothetical protein